MTRVSEMDGLFGLVKQDEDEDEEFKSLEVKDEGATSYDAHVASGTTYTYILKSFAYGGGTGSSPPLPCRTEGPSVPRVAPCSPGLYDVPFHLLCGSILYQVFDNSAR